MAKSVPSVVIQAFENHTVCSDMSDQNVKCLETVQRAATKQTGSLPPKPGVRQKLISMSGQFDHR